jgi:riboflavin biosynthesis pyrimidine reductase
MAPRVQRVFPTPAAALGVREAYDVVRPAPDGRPYVGLCMIASLDGTVVVDGSSGGLGNATDLSVLLTLRDLADVIVVGAGTAKGEGYGPPRKAGQRIGVFSNSGRVDLTSPLFTSGAGFVIAPRSAVLDESRCQVLRAGDERVDVHAALGGLATVVPDVRYVQAEGGPTLNAALLDADVIDELDLTLSPRMAGSDGSRVTRGALAVDARFELAHLLVDDDGFVFGRWLRAPR